MVLTFSQEMSYLISATEFHGINPFGLGITLPYEKQHRHIIPRYKKYVNFTPQTHQKQSESLGSCTINPSSFGLGMKLQLMIDSEKFATNGDDR